jgi:hypothetical protein
MLNGVDVRVPVFGGKYLLVCMSVASAPVPYVTANIRTSIKVEQALISQSTVHSDSASDGSD